MILTKEEVKMALDVNEKDYETSLIRLNTLPRNAMFMVDIEESVFAMYYDVANSEFVRFKLDYEYANQNVPVNPEESLHAEMMQDLLEEKRSYKKVGFWGKHYQKIFNMIWFCLVGALVTLLGFIYTIN